MFAAVLASGSCRHHQWQQVFFCTWWMTQACSRGACPIAQGLLSLGLRCAYSVGQPTIELIRDRAESRIAIAAHIVKAHAAAHDQHPFVTQRSKGLSCLKVSARIKIITQ